MLMNLAHRGASAYAPETTLPSFYLGLQMGATGLETDVKRTKDGVLVLFHDDTTARISAVDVNINETLYCDLLKIDLGSHKGEQYKGERIVRLEEFLMAFGGRDIDLAIELKDSLVEQGTISAIRRLVNDDSRLVITSFGYENLVRCRQLDSEIKLGYLTDDCLDPTLDKAAQIGCVQICPRVDYIDAASVAHAKERGFVVRSWGNDMPEKMRQSLAYGGDGMTVNFPDLMVEAIKEMGL